MLTSLRFLVYWACVHGLLPAALLLADAQTGDASSWHQYVRAPPNRTVAPKAILSQYTTGDVTNADALLSDDGNVAYLKRTSSTGDTPAVVIDFGQNVVGLLEIQFSGSQSYSAQERPGLKLIFSETLQFLGDRSDFTRSDNAGGDQKLTMGTDQVAVRGGNYTWLDQWRCEFGNQVCSDGLHGFRYVKIELNALDSDSPYTASEGKVGISSVRLQWSGYLGTPDTFSGWFECSDEQVTQWWFDAAYTTEMNTDVFRANDTEPRDATSPTLLEKMVIHDGPKRDRDPYMGDLAVSALTSYLTHDIDEAARNVMDDLIQHQRNDGWIPPASIQNYGLALFDYPLWWVSCSWEYVYYTGNVTYIQAYYQNMKLLLDTYYPAHTDSSNSLLLRADGYGDYAFLNRPGSAAYYSALYVLALQRAADLATVVNQSADADNWRQRADTVAKSFVEVLWDPSVNAFFDRKCDDDGCTAHAQDGNSLAILSGIVAGNSSEAASLLNYLSSSNTHPYGNSFYDAGGEQVCGGCSERVYPFISYFEIAARFEAGQATSALEQIRRTYGWMAAQDPGITAWEGIGGGGQPYEGGFTSMAHGWSTGVVPALSNYVLGVKPTGPGFKSWVVRPHPGDLTWARGVVPAPDGPIKVHWTLSDDQHYICLGAPSTTGGVVEIVLEGLGNRGVVVNGLTVWSGGNIVSSKATLVDGIVSVDMTHGEASDNVSCLDF
ncbi:alpha-L-rhamnosidase A [Pestalotiopsis sp. NC0098]|nr:alpha-L-rhamnosidase A [Pestalotiopsis sp. NC0098]